MPSQDIGVLIFACCTAYVMLMFLLASSQTFTDAIVDKYFNTIYDWCTTSRK